MAQIRSAADIRLLGTILFVAAHPDDETFMAGGIMATAASNGQAVVGVCMTRGEAGSQDESRWPYITLGDVREQEFMQAMRALGVTTHYIFQYPDGRCPDLAPAPAVAKLRDIIARHQPDTILTFGPDGMTGHPDHKVVCAWTNAAAQTLDKPPKIFHAVQTKENYEHNLKPVDEKLNMFFNIDKPLIVSEAQCAIAYHVPPGIEERKKRALAVMPSQTATLFSTLPAAVIDRAFAWEYFIAATS